MKSAPLVFIAQFTQLLTVLFIGLKLADFIDWSWWLVLLPLWMPWVVLFFLLTFFGWLLNR